MDVTNIPDDLLFHIAHFPSLGSNDQESLDVNFAEGDDNKQLPVCAMVSSWS